MLMTVLRKFSADQIWRYRSTRLPVRLYFPLALFLVVAGLANHPSPLPVSWLMTWFAAYMYVFQFRLWDDLADVNEDCQRDPDRVLCHASSLFPFIVFSLVLMIINLVLMTWHSGTRYTLIGYLLTCTLLVTWYRFRRGQLSQGIVNAHIVLLKYPVFVLLVGAPFAAENPHQMLIAMYMVYESFALYEIVHDRRYRGAAVSRALLKLHVALLAGAWIAVGYWVRAEDLSLQMVYGMAMVVGVWILAINLRGFRLDRQLKLPGMSIFIVSFIFCLLLGLTNYNSV